MLKPPSRHRPTAMFKQVKELLREKIASAQYQADDQLPDERTLSKQMGLSRMTVRRAVVELAHEGLLTRVRGKGTFVRGAFAPQNSKATGKIALIAPFCRLMRNSSYYYRLVNSLYDGAEKDGLSMVFKHAEEPYEHFISELSRDKSLTGLVVMGFESERFLQLLSRIKIPTVLCDSVVSTPPLFDAVLCRCDDAVVSAVESLLHLGHRELGLLTSDKPGAFTLQREEAYARALSSYGLARRDELIQRVNLCPVAAYARMRQILQQPQPPTAFFCVLDEIACAAMMAVRDHGWRVPRDVSIVGFGDLQVFTVPNLSSVRVPIEKLGSAAITQLLKRCNTPCAPAEQVFVDAEFVPRASCDCPRPLNAATVLDNRPTAAGRALTTSATPAS